MRSLRVGLGQDLGLRCADRCERAVALRLLREDRGALQALVRALAVAVLGVEHRRVIERARDLVEQAELVVELEALLVVEDRGLEVAVVLIVLRHAGVQTRESVAISEMLGERDRALVRRQRLASLAHVRKDVRQINEASEVEGGILHDAALARHETLAEESIRVFVRICP